MNRLSSPGASSSAVVLGKRRERSVSDPNLVLLLSGGSDVDTDSASHYSPSDYTGPDSAPAVSGNTKDVIASKPSRNSELVLINGRLIKSGKRLYCCTFEGCGKSYTKPVRLEEHERTHTGEVRESYS